MNVELREEFDKRFTRTLPHFIDRELREGGYAETLFGAESEYFGAMRDWIDANFISRQEFKEKALSLSNPFTDPYQNTAFNIGAESVINLLRR